MITTEKERTLDKTETETKRYSTKKKVTCLGSPFLPPIVVEIICPVTGSFPSATRVVISYQTHGHQ
jgi:hypothetical protein